MIPQIVELSGLVFTAAGAAVPEAGQGWAHLHALHRHGALDCFAKLDGEKTDGSQVELIGIPARGKQEKPDHQNFYEHKVMGG